MFSNFSVTKISFLVRPKIIFTWYPSLGSQSTLQLGMGVKGSVRVNKSLTLVDEWIGALLI